MPRKLIWGSIGIKRVMTGQNTNLILIVEEHDLISPYSVIAGVGKELASSFLDKESATVVAGTPPLSLHVKIDESLRLKNDGTNLISQRATIAPMPVTPKRDLGLGMSLGESSIPTYFDRPTANHKGVSTPSGSLEDAPASHWLPCILFPQT